MQIEPVGLRNLMDPTTSPDRAPDAALIAFATILAKVRAGSVPVAEGEQTKDGGGTAPVLNDSGSDVPEDQTVSETTETVLEGQEMHVLAGNARMKITAQQARIGFLTDPSSTVPAVDLATLDLDKNADADQQRPGTMAASTVEAAELPDHDPLLAPGDKKSLGVWRPETALERAVVATVQEYIQVFDGFRDGLDQPSHALAVFTQTPMGLGHQTEPKPQRPAISPSPSMGVLHGGWSEYQSTRTAETSFNAKKPVLEIAQKQPPVSDTRSAVIIAPALPEADPPPGVTEPAAILFDDLDIRGVDLPAGSMRNVPSLDAVPNSARFHAASVALLRDAAMAAASGNGQVIELDTGSDVLGKISLSIKSQDGALMVTLLSGRPDTLDILRRSISVFLRDLSAQGFEDVDVQLGPPSTQIVGFGNPPRLRLNDSHANVMRQNLPETGAGIDRRL